MSLVEKLIEDPIEFGKKNPMHPNTPPIGPGGWSKEKRTQRDKFFQVRGEDRIVWFAFTKSFHGPGGYSFDFSEYPKPGYEPVYWLPWGMNQIYRTALRPSRKFEDEDWKTEYGVRMFRDTVEKFSDTSERDTVFNHRMKVLEDLGNLRPKIFFTAAVNGCSVFIEGTEEEPIVYHANASDHLAGFDEVDSAELFTVLRWEKIQHMEKRYREFSESHAKGPRNPNLQPAKPSGGVNMGHYLSPVQDPRFHKWFSKEVNEIANKYVEDVNRAKFIWSSYKEFKLEEGVGTVYGVEKNGKWKFYYQKLVFITVMRDDGVFKSDWKKVSHWHTVECENFWPDGTGRFNLS
ncbi:MAG TPA: hypothetical protein VN493_13125 [Thermoanaerobaculia bacterium]|nr:hypothetical protein [Thermoanaerobaculia bacterium]